MDYQTDEVSGLSFKIGTEYLKSAYGKAVGYSYADYTKGISCYIDILIEDKEYDSKEAVGYSTTGSKDIKYSEKTINGAKWTTGTGTMSGDRKVKAFSIGKNNKQYTIVYKYEKDACIESLETFENSLNFK